MYNVSETVLPIYINGQCPIIKTCSDVTLNLSCKDSNSEETYNQRTHGPVNNAHLISGPSISTKHTKPGYKWPSDFRTTTFNFRI